MPAYVGFLRAINLGRQRRFPKDGIVRATEAAGGRDVGTYIASGNVRLTHGARSTAKVQRLLEEAYAAEAGFEVPTIVFTTAELTELVARGAELEAEHAPQGRHYVTLFATPPTAEAVRAVHGLDLAGERMVVEGRAGYGLLDGNIHTSVLLSSKQVTALGVGTARSFGVLRTIVERWC